MFRLTAARLRFHPDASNASLIIELSICCFDSLTTPFMPNDRSRVIEVLTYSGAY